MNTTTEPAPIIDPVITPKVGDGATLQCWSDRHACTVIAVSESGKRITLQEDTATRTDNNGRSECQSYTFARNPSGKTHVVILRPLKRPVRYWPGDDGFQEHHRCHEWREPKTGNVAFFTARDGGDARDEYYDYSS